MALLVCGAEGEWALFNNTLSTVGADDKRRGSVALGIGQQMFKAFPGSDDIWAHIRVCSDDVFTTNGSSEPTYFVLRDSGGDPIAGLYYLETGNTGEGLQTQIKYAPTQGAGLTIHPEIFPGDALVFDEWDFRIQRSTTTNPNDTLRISVYRNAQLRFDTTLTDASGFNQPAQIVMNNRRTDNEPELYVQDVIVSDAIPTVGMELAVLIPSAVGNYNAFDNDYTNIDDNGYDSSTVIATANTGDRESWVFSTPTFDLGDKVIYAVVLDTVAQTDLAAIISDFQPFLRISATNYAGANIGANNVNPDSYITIYTQNPATSNPWQQSELTGLEAGILSV